MSTTEIFDANIVKSTVNDISGEFGELSSIIENINSRVSDALNSPDRAMYGEAASEVLATWEENCSTLNEFISIFDAWSSMVVSIGNKYGELDRGTAKVENTDLAAFKTLAAASITPSGIEIDKNSIKKAKAQIRNSIKTKQEELTQRNKEREERRREEAEKNKATGNVITDSNGVIDTSKPVYKGNKYNVSDDELVFLAYIGYREQGSVEGAKLEISQICKLFESSYNGGRYTDLKTFVQSCGWYGSNNYNYSNPGNEYVEVARSVVNEGNRYLPSNVVEHDCLSDIESISTGSPGVRANYIPNETIIHNNMGATYKFVGFAPNGGDPFGFLV